MNYNTSVLYHHGNHDQSTHGNWSRGRAAAARYKKSNSREKKDSTNKNTSVLDKVKAGYDKTYEMLADTIGHHNMRYARDSLAYASAALWLAAEFTPMGAPLSALAAVTNDASIIIDPDD